MNQRDLFLFPHSASAKLRSAFSGSSIECLDAAFLQARPQLGEMSVVSRFDGALNVDRGNVGAGKGAIMHDLFNARAGRGDFRREIGEAAGTIADNRREARQTAIGDESPLDDAAQHIRIDVASAE